MTVLMFQKRFAAPILAGSKHQTIRPKRKRPIKAGERLSLRYWKDKAYRSPQVEFSTAVAVGTLDIEIHEAGIKLCLTHLGRIELDTFARSDGFSDFSEMLGFFNSRFGYGLPFSGDLIQWE